MLSSNIATYFDEKKQENELLVLLLIALFLFLLVLIVLRLIKKIFLVNELAGAYVKGFA